MHAWSPSSASRPSSPSAAWRARWSSTAGSASRAAPIRRVTNTASHSTAPRARLSATAFRTSRGARSKNDDLCSLPLCFGRRRTLHILKRSTVARSPDIAERHAIRTARARVRRSRRQPRTHRIAARSSLISWSGGQPIRCHPSAYERSLRARRGASMPHVPGRLPAITAITGQSGLVRRRRLA